MPIEPHTEIGKLRIRISNYRAIIRKKKKGIKMKNARTWAVMSRIDYSTTRASEIATFEDKQEALDFYQDFIKKRLKDTIEELRKISPQDIYLKEPSEDSPESHQGVI